ncbi:hypothetical protein LDENG_00062370 [Lucifuga dentata]|nr:hypothetical protein LDENG_00062370 [Lucifuga dentata]
MANFTVEWLSKSYYTTQKNTEDVILRHKTQVKYDAHHSEEFLNTETEELAKKSRIQFSPTSPNDSCDYASSSESEVGDDSEGEGAQQRRMRTKFTSEQISKLENTFSKHKYLGATQRRKLAEKLNLSETQVKTWFQNRRMKLKREVQDMRPDFYSVPSGLLSPFPFQHTALRGQLPAYRAFYAQPVHKVHFPLNPHHSHPVILPPPFY